MLIKEGNDCVVEKTLTWDEYTKDKSYCPYPSIFRKSTDIFNKRSRTTVCFLGKDDAKVMHCEHCNKTHYNNMDIILDVIKMKDSSNNSKEDLEVKSVKCKDCGTEYPINDIRIIERIEKRFKHNTRFVYTNIFNDEKLVKLSFKTCSIFVDKAFYFEDNRYKIIFNPETGHTYLYNAPENKKTKFKFIPVAIPISNVTYLGDVIDNCFFQSLIDADDKSNYISDIIKEIHDALYEKLSKRLDYKAPTLKDYAAQVGIDDESSIYTFRNIMLYNRYPNVNTFNLISMCKCDSYGKVELPKKFRIIKQGDNVSSKIAELYKLSNKSLLDEYFENYNEEESKNIYDVILYLTLFKNQKYIKKLINNKDVEIFFFDSKEFDDAMKRKYNRTSNQLMLFEDIAKNVGEYELYLILEKYLKDRYSKEILITISTLYYDLRLIDKTYNFDLKELCNILLNKVNLKNAYYDSYKTLNIIYEFLYKINDYIYEKHKESFKFKIKKLDEYYNEFEKHIDEDDIFYNKPLKINPLVTKIYKINPTVNPYTMLEMFNLDDERDVSLLPSFFKELDSKSTDVIGDILRYYKIPVTKSIRKAIVNNPSCLSSLVYYSSLFKDINILNNLIKNDCKAEVGLVSKVENLLYTCNSVVFSSNSKVCFDNTKQRYYISNSDEVAYKLLQRMIDEKGEVVVSKKLIANKKNSIRYILTDIARMYSNYIELYNNEDIDFNGSLLEIHDRLVSLTGRPNAMLTKADLKPFKYSEEEKALSFEQDGYSFDLAENGKELCQVGYVLKNCVGSYVKSVKRKECIIVPVKFKGEYKICIELQKTKNDKYALNQAKLYANTSVYEDFDSLKVVKEWMDKNDIIDKSVDLNNRYTNDSSAILDNFEFEPIYGEAVPF